LNKILRRDRYPLPNMDGMLHRLRGTTWHTAIDLISGFMQIPIKKEDQPKLAFVIPDRAQFTFVKLPFGLSNASSYFQRAVDSMLQGLLNVCAMAFVDDCIISSKDFDTHLSDMRKVFERMAASGVKISIQKCKFAMRELTYLGHEVMPEGIKPSTQKVEAVQEIVVAGVMTRKRKAEEALRQAEAEKGKEKADEEKNMNNSGRQKEGSVDEENL